MAQVQSHFVVVVSQSLVLAFFFFGGGGQGYHGCPNLFPTSQENSKEKKKKRKQKANSVVTFFRSQVWVSHQFRSIVSDALPQL